MGSTCHAAGAQLGYIIRMGELQGYFNLKCYEPSWNVRLTFVLTPVPRIDASAKAAKATH